MRGLALRRFGGVALVFLGVLVLAGPLSLVISPPRVHDPKMLSGLAYQATLGLFLFILGLYFLTRRPTKAPEDHD